MFFLGLGLVLLVLGFSVFYMSYRELSARLLLAAILLTTLGAVTTVLGLDPSANVADWSLISSTYAILIEGAIWLNHRLKVYLAEGEKGASS